MQNHHNHPVRLRLPPLRRRGMVRHRKSYRYDTTTFSGCACHPSEGWEWSDSRKSYRYDTTTPSGCACHPSTGGELSDTVNRYRYDTTTPSGCACHPSEGGEWFDTVNRTDMTQPPGQAAPATPPQEGYGPTP